MSDLVAIRWADRTKKKIEKETNMPHLSQDKVMNLLKEALEEVAHEREFRTHREQSLVSTKIEEAIQWRRTDLMRNTDTDFS